MWLNYKYSSCQVEDMHAFFLNLVDRYDKGFVIHNRIRSDTFFQN